MCEICSKLTVKKPERRQWRLCVVFLLTLTDFSYSAGVFIIDFGEVAAAQNTV